MSSDVAVAATVVGEDASGPRAIADAPNRVAVRMTIALVAKRGPRVLRRGRACIFTGRTLASQACLRVESERTFTKTAPSSNHDPWSGTALLPHCT